MNVKFDQTKINFPIIFSGKKQAFRHLYRGKILTATNIILGICLIPVTVVAQITPAKDGTGTTIQTQGNNINISGGSLSSDKA
ncbi:hypothetical protein LC593_36595, partial [Nostoc sp. CHAB 5844]|nr:hypothetical protein [Nostoc sp. CHAB 5844]